MKKPTPAEIDALAAEYVGLEAQKSLLENQLKPLRERLLALCAEYGAAHAEKSTRLAGREYELVRSQGQTVSVDQVGVAKLYTLMKKSRAFDLFLKLFVARVQYCVADKAYETLDGKLPARAPRNLRALFHEMVHIDPAAPRLAVRPVKGA